MKKQTAKELMEMVYNECPEVFMAEFDRHVKASGQIWGVHVKGGKPRLDLTLFPYHEGQGVDLKSVPLEEVIREVYTEGYLKGDGESSLTSTLDKLLKFARKFSLPNDEPIRAGVDSENI